MSEDPGYYERLRLRDEIELLWSKLSGANKRIDRMATTIRELEQLVGDLQATIAKGESDV